MKAYFKLQIKLINRTLVEMGTKPVFGYPLAILLFCGISLLLFIKTEYAVYIYELLALSLAIKLSELKRNEFLKNVFSTRDYRKIRTTENAIVVLPFVLFLVYKQLYVPACILIFLSVLLANFSFKSPFRFTVPTPFGKKPFEFPVGFRKTFYVFPLAYYLTFQSVRSGNFNLGVFAILLIGFVVLTYYSKPEHEYYIWSYKTTAKGFILSKIKTGLLLFTYLSLPSILPLVIFFPIEFETLVLFIIICYAYVVTTILAKYSAYPYKLNLTEAMFIGLSTMFIPILVCIIPFLYYKSIRQLKPILEHD